MKNSLKEEYANLLKTPVRSDRKPLQELLPLDQPLRILIDPCDICNFKCNFCFQSTDRAFKGGRIEASLFEEIVRQLSEFERPINIVHLYGLGEPLLNKDVPKYVKLLKDRHAAKEVAITSNGSMLTKEMSKQLVEAGLDRLSISLNGICDEHFRKNVGVLVNFKNLYEQIKYFYSIREKCHLHIKINGECFSESEQERFVELFKDYSDTLNIDHVVDVWSGISSGSGSVKTMYGEDIKSNAAEKNVCPQMFYEMMIHPDGSVSPCCVDYTYQKYNLGNVKQNTIKEIWQGEKLLKMRQNALKQDGVNYPICTFCQYPDCASTVNITPYRNEILEKYERICEE